MPDTFATPHYPAFPTIGDLHAIIADCAVIASHLGPPALREGVSRSLRESINAALGAIDQVWGPREVPVCRSVYRDVAAANAMYSVACVVDPPCFTLAEIRRRYTAIDAHLVAIDRLDVGGAQTFLFPEGGGALKITRVGDADVDARKRQIL